MSSKTIQPQKPFSTLELECWPPRLHICTKRVISDRNARMDAQEPLKNYCQEGGHDAKLVTHTKCSPSKSMLGRQVFNPFVYIHSLVFVQQPSHKTKRQHDDTKFEANWPGALCFF